MSDPSAATMATASTSRMPNEKRPVQQPPSPQKALPTPSFWQDIHRIRTNGFEYTDNSTGKQPQQRRWAFKSRKSHILDTNGHYTWDRELNCYQLQNLPEEVFPNNTLEITLALSSSGDNDNNNNNHEPQHHLRIRFGALEGLRGWISLDAPPIPTAHALDSAHWKYVASQGQLPSNHNNKAMLGKRGTNESILSTSYDYAFTTLYKGGTDVIQQSNSSDESNSNSNDNDNYHYLHPNSTSFVPKHDASANDLQAAAKGPGMQIQKVKVRKPICKCKSDGGRAPLVGPKKESSASTTQESLPSTTTTTTASLPPTPHWTLEETYRVDIESMLRHAVATAVNKQRPFLFREDVDLWEDDLHDNGEAWLKARCFVCQQGWACLLRNFIRVDGVLCRVIDTRYIHTFGTTKVYREHSWREGPWEPLVRAIQREKMAHPAASSPHPAVRRPINGPLPVSFESINDSVAARHLPLKKRPVTECLDLGMPVQQNQHTNQQLVWIQNETIEDAIPVPNSEVQDTVGISFVLKRSKGTILEAISSSAKGDQDSSSIPVSSLWSKAYDSSNDTDSTILSVQISPNPTDGGRLAIGDDRGRVNVWRLSTGESLWDFPVAPQSILNRLDTNPYFESARLWVDHLAWSADGSLVGASAGRNAVLAAKEGVLAAQESASGTVTGLGFCKRPDQSFALAVASYGEVTWLYQDQEKEENKLETLTREGAAIECIDVSPDGKQVAVGFLDKTLRIFQTGTEKQAASKENSVVDWVGFSAPVKSVRFNTTGHWLAAMGGNAILVINETLAPRAEPPIVCRTPGQTKADGGDGSCHKFEGIEWSSGDDDTVLLAALDATISSVHVFRFSKHGPDNISQNAWPIQILPVLTVSPPFANPSPSIPTRFAFFSDKKSASNEERDAKGISFLVLDRPEVGIDDDHLGKALGSQLSIGNSDERLSDASAKHEEFSFRIVL